MVAKPATETPRTPAFICSGGEYKEPKHDKVIIVKRGGIEVERKVQIKGKVRELLPDETPIFYQDSGLIGVYGSVYYYHLIGLK